MFPDRLGGLLFGDPAGAPVFGKLRADFRDQPLGLKLQQRLPDGLEFLRAALVDAIVQQRAQFVWVGRSEFAHTGIVPQHGRAAKGKRRTGVTKFYRVEIAKTFVATASPDRFSMSGGFTPFAGGSVAFENWATRIKSE